MPTLFLQCDKCDHFFPYGSDETWHAPGAVVKCTACGETGSNGIDVVKRPGRVDFHCAVCTAPEVCVFYDDPVPVQAREAAEAYVRGLGWRARGEDWLCPTHAPPAPT